MISCEIGCLVAPPSTLGPSLTKLTSINDNRRTFSKMVH
jgi:hypothetical protein